MIPNTYIAGIITLAQASIPSDTPFITAHPKDAKPIIQNIKFLGSVT